MRLSYTVLLQHTADTIQLLMQHYVKSDQIDIEAFDLFVEFRDLIVNRPFKGPIPTFGQSPEEDFPYSS